MRWIRVNEYHYVNEDQLRDIQFIKKGLDEWYYRLFYTNGQNLEVKGFDNLEDALEHADKTFGFTKKEEKATPATKTKRSVGTGLK